MFLFIVRFLGMKYKPAWPKFPLKAPHTITLPGCFVVLTVNLGSYRDRLLGRKTNFGTPLTSVKVLLSQNITFLHSAAVQCRYFWQKFSLFFFIAAVSVSFLAARRHGRQRLTGVDDKLSWLRRSGEAHHTKR